MPRELRGIVRALGLRRRTLGETFGDTLGGTAVWAGDGALATAVGVGPARARAGISEILDTLDVRKVVVAGVAGAIDPHLRIGEVLAPVDVVDAGTGRRYVPHARDADAARTGVLVSVDRVWVPGAPGASVEIPAGATAVDMETAAIAEACEARGVPWDVVRAISDLPGTVTIEVTSLLRPDGSADLLSAAKLVARRPGEVVRLVRLAYDTNRAVAAMTRVVLRDLEELGIHRTR